MKKDLPQLVEALIFAADAPLNTDTMTTLLSSYLNQVLENKTVQSVVEELAIQYEQGQYAFQLLESGGGFQFVTKPEFHKLVAGLNGDKFQKKLSRTSMETLSIIAYKQPVTKSEIEFIRGVAADYSIQKLLEKELVYIKGRKEDAVGKPLIYATTPYFMDYLGINDVSELPKLKEIVVMTPIEETKGEAAAAPKAKEQVEDASFDYS